MPKVSLNVWSPYVSVKRLADVLEEFNVPCDRKRNGNIWAKANQKASYEMLDLQDAVYDVFREHGGKVNYSAIDYDFFDHGGAYTANDGTSVFMFTPYRGESHWPGMIPYLWEKGYYVAMYDREYCHSRNYVVLIRKRKEEDEMFRFIPEYEEMPVRELDFTRYVR